MNEQGKLYQAQANYQAEEAKSGGAVESNASLDEKRHNRGYNPVDDAKRSNVSSELNNDAARYKKGPGPF